MSLILTQPRVLKKNNNSTMENTKFTLTEQQRQILTSVAQKSATEIIAASLPTAAKLDAENVADALDALAREIYKRHIQWLNELDADTVV